MLDVLALLAPLSVRTHPLVPTPIHGIRTPTPDGSSANVIMAFHVTLPATILNWSAVMWDLPYRNRGIVTVI